MIFSAFDAVTASGARPVVEHQQIKGLRGITSRGNNKIFPLNEAQKDYVKALFDRYDVLHSSSLLHRMRWAQSDSPSIGAFADQGIYVFPSQILASKSSMPADSTERYAEPSIQAYYILFEEGLYKNRSGNSRETISAAEQYALCKMKCPSCIHEVSRYHESLGMQERLVEAGQRIHDPKYIKSVIDDLDSKAVPCKSCQGVLTDKVWVRLK